MIEAMACGTPVIAWRCGSVPEVVEERKDRLHRRRHGPGSRRAGRLRRLSRARVRAELEEQFTAQAMANRYVQLYWQLALRQPGRVVGR